MVNIGLKSILKRKRGPPGGLAGAPNPTHGLCSPGKQAQPTKNHENTAPARAPALISEVGHSRGLRPLPPTPRKSCSPHVATQRTWRGLRKRRTGGPLLFEFCSTFLPRGAMCSLFRTSLAMLRSTCADATFRPFDQVLLQNPAACHPPDRLSAHATTGICLPRACFGA